MQRRFIWILLSMIWQTCDSLFFFISSLSHSLLLFLLRKKKGERKQRKNEREKRVKGRTLEGLTFHSHFHSLTHLFSLSFFFFFFLFFPLPLSFFSLIIPVLFTHFLPSLHFLWESFFTFVMRLREREEKMREKERKKRERNRKWKETNLGQTFPHKKVYFHSFFLPSCLLFLFLSSFLPSFFSD